MKTDDEAPTGAGAEAPQGNSGSREAVRDLLSKYEPGNEAGSKHLFGAACVWKAGGSNPEDLEGLEPSVEMQAGLVKAIREGKILARASSLAGSGGLLDLGAAVLELFEALSALPGAERWEAVEPSVRLHERERLLDLGEARAIQARMRVDDPFAGYSSQCFFLQCVSMAGFNPCPEAAAFAAESPRFPIAEGLSALEGGRTTEKILSALDAGTLSRAVASRIFAGLAAKGWRPGFDDLSVLVKSPMAYWELLDPFAEPGAFAESKEGRTLAHGLEDRNGLTHLEKVKALEARGLDVSAKLPGVEDLAALYRRKKHLESAEYVGARILAREEESAIDDETLKTRRAIEHLLSLGMKVLAADGTEIGLTAPRAKRPGGL